VVSFLGISLLFLFTRKEKEAKEKEKRNGDKYKIIKACSGVLLKSREKDAKRKAKWNNMSSVSLFWL